MKILSFECSAGPASVALIDDGRLLGSSYVNIKLTHSQTLMPSVCSLLDATKTELSEIDYFAVAAGPGSFTGIRIGISAVKGLAEPDNIPCVPVSTLRGITENFKDRNAVICPVMDARCNQLYNALFESDGKNIDRMTPDRAIMCNELAKELTDNFLSQNREIIICGDGADLFYPYVESNALCKKASEPFKYQSAVGVGFAALNEISTGNTVSPQDLLPVYLRLPQAERELKMKKEEK